MTENKRQHKRIDKIISLHYVIPESSPKIWDMSIIINISVGGIRFIAPSDLKFKDKVVQIRIKLPHLAPDYLELEAMIIDVTPRPKGNQSEVRAKFINLSETSKEHLSVLEKMIEAQEIKNARKL